MDIARQLLLKDVKLKAARFCAYQERCTSEVQAKLAALGCSEEDIVEMIAWLESEKYLDDARYAESYVRGKLRYSQWGKIKIRQHLLVKGISKAHITSALAKIDEVEYSTVVESLIAKKSSQVKVPDIYTKNHKVAQFVISRGFEPELVWELIKKSGKSDG